MEKVATFLSCFHAGLTGDPTICLLVDIQLTIIINAVTIIIMEKHITVPVCVYSRSGAAWGRVRCIEAELVDRQLLVSLLCTSPSTQRERDREDQGEDTMSSQTYQHNGAAWLSPAAMSSIIDDTRVQPKSGSSTNRFSSLTSGGVQSGDRGSRSSSKAFCEIVL